ncbi:hypothetical protein HCA58_10485 [Micromonospora sp. HNM0581]|uniref:hypothetical protein n=1 Tax=Micromonospora sp. HNM0581 TaxID=2716341 RepID=UPI00146B0D18|nr:hypothetical protein [Micromonospora sp. HNM0581]
MTTPTSAPLTPYATLLGFTRYVDRTGPTKASFVGGLRRQRASRSGFNPHGQFVKALKADVAFHTGGTHLAQVVDVVKPRWRPLYQALTPGATAWLRSLGDPAGVDLAQTRDALAMLGDLPIKINPHFGIRYADGHAEAVRLHFDENPPSEEATLAALHLTARHMDAVLPHAEPVLVDVRRSITHRMPDRANTDEIERWLAGEAAAFRAIWSAAA